MKLKKLASALLSSVIMFTMAFTPTNILADNTETNFSVDVNFTAMSSVPVYSKATGQGFISKSNAILPEKAKREVADTSKISVTSDNGAQVTESDGNYLKYVDSEDWNYGGLIYRVDTNAPGAYHLEVEVTGDSSDTWIAPTGMRADRLTGTSPWDTAGLVRRLTSAKWDGSKWTYDFVTGQDFIEIEIEPNKLPTPNSPKTVGVKSIKITPLNPNTAGDKPTIHILGDSTQKTYTFISTISTWGQTLIDYFDLEKVNVVNYSMGGRAMKSNYIEGRIDDILMRGKEGDFVFIHSAHNDESGSPTSRFIRGTQYGTLEQNNTLYNEWLDMYIAAIKSRGMTPVLVTSMPRTGNGRYSENSSKPNGFNPDAPGNMRTKAKTSSEIGLVELYAGAKEYIDSLDSAEIFGIYNSFEAGETPAASDGASQANGQEKSDGTHYREAAARQWCRIMLQSIYNQSVATEDTYNDKDIMTKLTSYMKSDVKTAAQSGDWSTVFPEMAVDVSAKGVVPGAEQQPKENYYYRNSIEKLLQLGIMKKDSNNKFYPTNIITVGDFARSVEKAFDLEKNSLTSYTKTYEELQNEGKVSLISVKDNENVYNADFESVSLKSTSLASTIGEVEAKVLDGNTVVNLKNIDKGIIVAAKYIGEKLQDLKTSNITSDKSAYTISGIEADSIFVWDSLESMKPLCETYKINSSAEGEFKKVIVNKPDGAKITIYNESDHKTYNANVKQVETNSIISDNDFFTLKSPSRIVSGTDKNGTFNNNDVKTDYIEIRNDGREFTYTAKANGTLTLYMRAGNSKDIVCKNINSDKTEIKYITGKKEEDGASVYNSVDFTVEAGNEYQLYVVSGTGRLFGVQFANEYENSTNSLSVSDGTTIRVIVERENNNWLIDSILVNGIKVNNAIGSSLKKECTFTVSGNTTVSANLIENTEPKLVEITIIPIDAKLTREAMAAILYDAYVLKYGKNKDGNWEKPVYMTKYNGTSLAPDHPDYDPNFPPTSGNYYPLKDWTKLEDVADSKSFNSALYGKSKEVYNLGLMRADTDVSRGTYTNGTKFEPKQEVTRAKAAKVLAFLYTLTRPVNGEGSESQILPNGNLAANTEEIPIPNPNAPSTPVETK